MKDEGGRMKAEGRRRLFGCQVRNLEVELGPVYFILHPSSFILS